jgi:hypothetical protein
MCDLMSSNQPSISNYISVQNLTNSQANNIKNSTSNINGNGLNSSNSLLLLENSRSTKLTTDYKQIILELS